MDCSLLRNGNHTLHQKSWGRPSKCWGVRTPLDPPVVVPLRAIEPCSSCGWSVTVGRSFACWLHSAGADGWESFPWWAAQVHASLAVQVSLHVLGEERRHTVRPTTTCHDLLTSCVRRLLHACCCSCWYADVGHKEEPNLSYVQLPRNININ